MQTTTTTTRKRAASSAAVSGYRPKRSRRTIRTYFPKASTEWKYIDTTINQDVNTTATLTLLNGLSLGNTASTRIGQKITMQSMEAAVRLKTTAATGVEQFVRFLIVLDRQANGAAPALTDILLAANWQSPRNLNNRKRFKILYDYRNCLGATAASTGTETSRMDKIYYKFKKPYIVDYNSSNFGDIRDISSNSLYFCTVGSAAADDTDSNLITTLRLRYTDM